MGFLADEVYAAHFDLERLDFGLKMLILGHLSLQKAASKHGLFGNALWREHIDIAKLVFALAEVMHLHPALVDERFQAIVESTGADAQFFGNLALGHVRVVLQHAQDSEVGVFLELGSAAGHLRGFWPRYRHAMSRSASALGAVP